MFSFDFIDISFDEGVIQVKQNHFTQKTSWSLDQQWHSAIDESLYCYILFYLFSKTRISPR